MRKYEYLLLDADNTLFDFDRAEVAAFTECCREFGLPYSDEFFARYIEINIDLWRRLESGEITRDELKYQRFARLIGDGEEARRVSLGYIDILGRQAFLFDGAAELCSRLAEKYKLYIITNGIASVQHGRIDPSPIAPLLDGLFISEEIGAQKPEGAFFDYVMNAVGDGDGRKYLVIGDSLTSDIAGAEAAGLDCVWMNIKNEDAGEHSPTYTVTKLDELYPILL